MKPTGLAAMVVASAGVAAAAWWLTRSEPIRVAIAPVERGTVRSSVANTRAGSVTACRRARMSPAIGGRIARLPAREGERVDAGDLLLELWNEDRRAQVRLAERELAAARAHVDEVCTLASVARREAERLVDLRRRGVASPEATEKAVGTAEAKEASCTAARAQAEVATARLDVARAELARTRLYAPFAGTVAEINGEVGEYVTPSPVGIATPPAIDLIDTTCLFVEAPIDEVDAGRVRVGLPARVALDAFPDRTFPGHVRRVASYVLDREKQARTVDVEVELDDREEMPPLLVGYSADVEVILERRDDVLRVPTDAVLEGPRVLVLDEGLLESRPIRVGISNWQYTEVTDGLAAGERVVVSIDREGVEAGARAVAEDDEASEAAE